MDTSNRDDNENSFFNKFTDLLIDGGITVAKTSGIVFGYSGKMLRGIKNTGDKIPMPNVSKKWAKGLFTGGVMKQWGGEQSTIKINIAKSKEKINSLYHDIGKLGATFSDSDDISSKNSVKELILEVKSHEQKIKIWENRLKELKLEKKECRKKIRSKKITIQEENNHVELKGNIKKLTDLALKKNIFESSSQKVIFEKVANDLIDDDLEIRILSSAELGKIGNSAAVPILSEALKYNNVYLSCEVINSLINLNDSSSVPIFKNNVTHENFRVRLACIRGLYKIGGSETLSLLIDALKDEHKDIRKSASTFLGWLGEKEAVPALIQAIKDQNNEVKKAAIMSLSSLRDPSAVMPLIRSLKESNLEDREKIIHAIERITGKTVEFDLSGPKNQINDKITTLKDWWQKHKTADIDSPTGDIDEIKNTPIEPDDPNKVEGTETTINDTEKKEPETTLEADQAATEQEIPATAKNEINQETNDTEQPSNNTDNDTTANSQEKEVEKEPEASTTNDQENKNTDPQATNTEQENKSAEISDSNGEKEEKSNGKITEVQLNNMLKKDLLAKCSELKIEYSYEDSKYVIIQKILEQCGN